MHDRYVGDDDAIAPQTPKSAEDSALRQADAFREHPGWGLIIDLNLREEGAVESSSAALSGMCQCISTETAAK